MVLISARVVYEPSVSFRSIRNPLAAICGLAFHISTIPWRLLMPLKNKRFNVFTAALALKIEVEDDCDCSIWYKYIPRTKESIDTAKHNVAKIILVSMGRMFGYGLD